MASAKNVISKSYGAYYSKGSKKIALDRFENGKSVKSYILPTKQNFSLLNKKFGKASSDIVRGRKYVVWF